MGPRKNFLNYNAFVLIIANSVEPDEMQHHAAFHLGPYCLPKYPFRDFQYTCTQRVAIFNQKEESISALRVKCFALV